MFLQQVNQVAQSTGAFHKPREVTQMADVWGLQQVGGEATSELPWPLIGWVT